MSALVLPTIHLDRVYHIGTLHEAPRGLRESYEGNALSVSHAPLAWRQIARLGGYPLWELQHTDGRFLDVCELGSAREILLERAAIEGFVRRLPLFCAYHDDELGDSVYSTYLSEAEARNEEPEHIERIEGYTMTERLAQMFSVRIQHGEPAEDFAIMSYAQRLGFDGAWWHERYDPNALSAPRGCIFQGNVVRWTPREIQFARIDDDEALLSRFPRTRMRRYELDAVLRL